MSWSGDVSLDVNAMHKTAISHHSRTVLANGLKLAGAVLRVMAFLAAPRTLAQTLYWDTNGALTGSSGLNGTWGTNKYWSTSSAGTATTTAFTSGRDTVFSAGTNATGTYTVTVSGTQNVSSISVGEGTVTFSGGTIKFNDATPDFVVASGLTTTVSSVISGTNGINVSGAGLLVFNGTAKTYTGTTSVTVGTLRLDASNMIVNTSALAVASGATFELNWGVTETLGALSGAGLVNIRGNTFTVGDASNTTFSGVLSDAGAYGSLVKQGTGSLTLSGANTYTGPTTINAGAIIAANSSALGSGAAGNTVASGAALQLQGGITLTEGSFSVTGTGVGGTGAISNLSGTNSLNSAVTLGGNTTIGSAGGALTISGQVDLGTANTLTVAGAGGTEFSEAITNSGAITKTGTGTLTFSGITANSSVGTLAINDGTVVLNKTAGTNAYAGSGGITAGDGTGAAASAVLRLGASNQIADYAGIITVNSDGLFDLNNQSEAVNTIAGTGRIDTGTAGALTVGANSGSSSFGGSLLGTGSFTKTGTGVLTLTSNLTFNGTFNLEGGTLRLSDMTLTLATLNLTGNSTIDFAGSISKLYVTTLNLNGFTLTVTNWANATDYFFATNWSGATVDTRNAVPMNQVTFNGFTAADTKWQSYDHQVTPVPEPGTYGAMLLGPFILLFAWRRRSVIA